MKLCDFGAMSIAGQLLLMLMTAAVMAVNTVGISGQAATLIASIICMDLSENEQTIGHIHVSPFRYNIVFTVQSSLLLYSCFFCRWCELSDVLIIKLLLRGHVTP